MHQPSSRILLQAVIASGVVGALAGASWPLPSVVGEGTATGADVFAWAIAGLLLGASVAIVCVSISTSIPQRGLVLLPLAMGVGLLLSLAMSLWVLRNVAEVEDGLVFRGVLGTVLGLLVGVTIRVVLLWSTRKRSLLNSRR